jgi:predicted metal-dependent hydrolase
MGSYFLRIEKVYKGTPILVEKKKIKNVHLKVFRDLTVKCSFPESATDEYIEKFFLDRIDWINKQLEKYRKATGADNYECLRDGSCIQMLGKDYRIFIKQAQDNKVVEDVKSITIFNKNIANENAIRNQFMNWWRARAEQIFCEILDTKYDKVIRKYGITKPTLRIRSMKTMWGTFNDKKNVATINDYLLKANMLQIEYVVLHELTHTRFKNHSQDFYNFMTIHMPDWQERKKSLDTQVAQGIT